MEAEVAERLKGQVQSSAATIRLGETLGAGSRLQVTGSE